VIGHPEYYTRFGFERAGRFGISSEWNMPDDAFMILILDRKVMNGITVVAGYRKEWAETM